MRKTVVAAITAGALALTSCTSDNDTDSTAPDNASDHFVTGPPTNQAELSDQFDELLLSSQGASSWDEVTEGWGRDVFDTEVNGAALLVHTTFPVNDGDAVDDAARIADEVVRLIRGHPATDQIGRVTITYYEGRGAYSAHL